MPAKKLSIIICTYNRSRLLSGAIESVFESVYEDIRDQIELVIVNNNSDDETEEIALEYKEKSPIDFIYAFEPKQGLSHARNKGIEVSSGEYLGYIDDECRINKQWLQKALEIIQTEKLDMFGGPYKPVFSEDPPSWVKPKYFGTAGWYDKDHKVTDKDVFLVGNNMIIQRDVFAINGSFDPDYGMTGNKIGYGEEVIFQKQLMKRKADAKIIFFKNLEINQLTSLSKTKFKWLFKASLAQGKSAAQQTQELVEKKDESKMFLLLKILYLLTSCVLGSIKNIIFRDKEKYPYWMNYFVEQKRREISAITTYYLQLTGH